MIRLTEKEIEAVDIHCGASEADGSEPYYHHKYEEHLNKAQLKKFVEWGYGICTDHQDSYAIGMKRIDCPQCRQALLEEIE